MSQFKLLIVDDEEDLVAMVERIYKRQGYLTFGATDGIKAVEIYDKERPDIIFIDIHMPLSPIDGVETLKRIKDINKGANCVMVTRIYEGDSIDKTKSLGALHYVTKPFEIEELDKCIEEVKEKQKT
jgi:two-component system response regulator (stage 0 sporulation protein F)